MTYALSQLIAHIHWVLAKPAVPGWADIRQHTDGHTFYYIHSGRGVFRHGEEEIAVEDGTFAYLWPGMPLYMKSANAQPLRMTMLFFDCAWLRKSGSEWEKAIPVERLRLPFLMHLKKDRKNKVGLLLREAEREWVPGDQGREARVQSGWYRLIQELHEAAETDENQGTAAELTDALRRFKDRLDRDFAADLRISELAEQSGFSPAYVRRTFLDRYGCTPKEYLDRLRNEHAVRRLLYTGDSVTDIARACGYPDVYPFSKAFKKRNGLSPSEYRREKR